jgi:hypothetical protein
MTSKGARADGGDRDGRNRRIAANRRDDWKMEQL